MAVQRAIIDWVSHHRKHHAFADEDGDPHSPHTTGAAGWRGALRGICHAHLGWLFDRDQHASARRYAPDLRVDSTIRLVDQLFFVWAFLGLLIPFAAGLALSDGDLSAGLSAPLWGGLVRIFLFHHAIWSVNSADPRPRANRPRPQPPPAIERGAQRQPSRRDRRRAESTTHTNGGREMKLIQVLNA
jgi:stearoyl-CoA desaturase (delta-9 desaturase)